VKNGPVSLINALKELEWPANEAAELARGAHMVLYQKRSTIFQASEAADVVYILLSGEVKLEFNTGDARLLVSLAHGGQMLGIFAPTSKPAPGTQHEQLLTARALSPCTVAIIPSACVVQALHRLPVEQLVRVLERTREQWTQLCFRLLTFLTMGVRLRLTHAIGEIAETFGVADEAGRLITLRLSHEDFAALVGASRPMVSKHLKELASDGVISKRRGRYVLLPPGPPPGEDEQSGSDGAVLATGSRGRHQVVGLGESLPAGWRATTGNDAQKGAKRSGKLLGVRKESGTVRSI
jgi:CRP/FNR family transcriptional regulator